MKPVPPPRPEYAPAVGVCVIALCLTGAALWFFFGPGAQRNDFYARYQEGIAWRTGGPLYEAIPSVNTHAPSITLLVFAPLSRLPYPVAQIIVTGLNVIAVALSLGLVRRALGLSRPAFVWLMGLLLASQSMFQHWAMGQFIGVLMYPMTRAWLAYRAGALVTAGSWMAPVIAMKPPFALAAILLPAPVWVTAGILSAAGSALTVPFTGWQPWQEWLDAGSAVTWIARPFNASLWGLAARIQLGHTGELALADLAPAGVLLVLAAAVLLASRVVREADPDRRFLLAGLWSVLASPLGWAYYLPMLLGPMTALWSSAWLVAAYLLLQAPIGDNGSHYGIVLGSAIVVGTLIGWIVWAIPARRAHERNKRSPRG